MNDDRVPVEVEVIEEDENDPESAFLTLASEIATLVCRIEDLPETLRENFKPSQDYSADLVNITKQLAAVNENIKVLRSFPYLSMTPQQHGQAIAQAGQELIADAAKDMEKASRAAYWEGEKLKDFLGHVRTVETQKKWLIRVGVSGLVLGLILFPLLAAILPLGFSERIAAGIAGKDRWNAGQALMEAGNPQAFAELVAANRLVTLNEGKIRECREAAAKAKKEQACPITIPIP